MRNISFQLKIHTKNNFATNLTALFLIIPGQIMLYTKHRLIGHKVLISSTSVTKKATLPLSVQNTAARFSRLSTKMFITTICWKNEPSVAFGKHPFSFLIVILFLVYSITSSFNFAMPYTNLDLVMVKIYVTSSTNISTNLTLMPLHIITKIVNTTSTKSFFTNNISIILAVTFLTTHLYPHQPLKNPAIFNFSFIVSQPEFSLNYHIGKISFP